MTMVRVFTHLDGSVRVMHLNERHRQPGETDSQFFTRETAKQKDLATVHFIDVDAADLPASRTQRGKWRVLASRVVVDLSVPDPPHPKQVLMDDVARANTLAELK